MRSRLALGFRGTSVSKTGFSSGATLSSCVERVIQDFLHVVPIRDDTKDAQYLYPALG